MSDKLNLINDILVDLFNHILRIEEKALKNQGVNLSMNEVHVLEMVEKTILKTMGEIAKGLHITTGALTVAVNRLVQKGYIERFRDKKDRRVVLLQLTEKAIEVLKVHNSFHEDMVTKMIKDLDIMEDEVLLQSLQNLKTFFYANYNS